MSGLSNFRNLISKTRWDYTRRYWVQRSVDAAGHVKLQPDCYSPAFLLELFRYAATLDADEAFAARHKGIAPRFQLLNLENVIAIDALWSLQGLHRPHTALFEWLDITEHRAHYPLPNLDDVAEAPRAPLPKAVPFLVGNQWDGDNPSLFAGQRSESLALANCVVTKVAKDGRTVVDLETELRMSVDLESAYLAMDFEWEGFRKRHAAAGPNDDWTSGYRFWVNYGTLTLGHSQALDHDEALRRTNWRFRNGFLGEEGNQRAQALAKAAVKAVPASPAMLELNLQVEPA